MTRTVVANVRLATGAEPVDVAMCGGVIEAITPTRGGGFGGRFAFPGYSDSHIHLDKAHLLGHAGEGISGAVAAVRAAKRRFTVSDVRDRAERVVCSAIAHGTTLMRSFVEVDPDAGLRSLEALVALRDEVRSRIELRFVAFAQDGTTGTPETLALLEQALRMGADEIGGCTYTDDDPVGHVRAVLDLAVAHGVRADFHVDFDLDPGADHLSIVLDETECIGWQGRVSVGHATRLAVLDESRRAALLQRMTDLGVPLVALPATDLYLVGAVAPASMVTAVATNNVCNPFTPFGDADLIRMANLFATVSRLASDVEVGAAWRAVTSGADTVLGTHRVIEPGAPATLVVLDAPDPVTAVRELRRPVAGWFLGRPSIAAARAEAFA